MNRAIRLCMAAWAWIPVLGWAEDVGESSSPALDGPVSVVEREEDFLSAVEAAVQRIRDSYDQLRLRHEEMSRQLRRSEMARRASERRQRELESKIASLSEDNTQLQLKLTRLTADLDDLRARYEENLRVVDRLEERIATTERQLRQLTREKEELEAALQRERARAGAAVEERMRLQATLEELRARIGTPAGSATSTPSAAVGAASGVRAGAGVGSEATTSGGVLAEPSAAVETARPSLERPAGAKATDATTGVSVRSEPVEATPIRVVESPPPTPEPVLERLLTGVAVPTGGVMSATASVEQLLGEAARAVSMEQWSRAREMYLEVLRRAPEDPVAMVGLVEAELELGDTEGAWRRALALLEKSPDHPQRLLLAGRVALRAGRKAEARQFLERVRQQDPRNVAALRELARLNFETLRYRDAAELFERVGTADPQDGVSWFNAAISWLKLDPPNIERATQCYRKAVELGEPRDERLEQRYGIQP